MNDLVLVVVGPHGVGKSTLCHALSARLGLPYDAELGESLRREALARDPGQHAQAPQEAFDRLVYERELARDAAHGTGGGRIVETWHPGNLAYAERRSPQLARECRAALAEYLVAWRSRALVVPLAMREETARARCTEPGDGDSKYQFFLDVGRRAEELARSFGLATLPAIETDEVAPVAVAKRVVAVLEKSALVRPGPSASREAMARQHRG